MRFNTMRLFLRTIYFYIREAKVVVLFLLIYCLMNFQSFVGVLCLSLICNAFHKVNSSFAIILERKKKLIALLLLSYRGLLTVNVLRLFLKMPQVGLQCVFAVFPDPTHFFIWHFSPVTPQYIQWTIKSVLHPTKRRMH